MFPDGQPVPEFLAPRDVARWLNIARGRVYTAIDKKELYCRKFSARQYRVPREAVIAWFYGRAN
ncbi:helix-turn-helix domain-containing protein [Deinococcus alpinitundrae]|uniref:helix-turn-helix domain-containing protein n=1 Tax=Deinococcus alpinitundrae TaxID=468913 RepID=UPI00137A232F|nr:helix-turn-helix domain-containing protein [Deinococcus alpinitundrae]